MCEWIYMYFKILYSGTPLVRPPLLRQKLWPFKRGDLSSGVEINTFMFRFTLSSGLSRGMTSQRVASQKGFHCIDLLLKRYDQIFGNLFKSY